jgi:hypothetical protein
MHKTLRAQDVRKGDIMLTDSSILYVRGEDNINGVPLVWVIDSECLYDIPTTKKYADMFMYSDEITDVSESYPDHDGITVRFIKNNQVVDELQTSEYFGSILLSNPLVLNLLAYPYGMYVVSPHDSFDGEKFIIKNADMSSLMAWHPVQNRNI